MKRFAPILLPSILGVFFLISGFGKALDTAEFAESIVGYGFPKQLRYIAPFVIALEIWLGLGLLLQVKVRRLALISMVVLAIFTVSFAYGYLHHGVTDCGCFGAFDALQTPPWVSFLRNGLLLLVAAWLYRKAPPAPLPTPFPLRTLISGATLVTFLLSAFLYVQHGTALRLSVSAGQAVRSSPMAPFCPPSPDSTYVVFIFSPTCPHCWAATPKIMQYRSSGLVSKVVALCPPATKENQQKYLSHFKPDFGIRSVTGKEILRISSLVPTAVFVRRDTILAVYTTRFPSADSLRLAFDASHRNTGYTVGHVRK
ncbi:DoxX family protein [Hymenobacter saemangeumensis]|uniref:DoxX family protein n=1 Tax=Hymenobacter saemangeumensis TaxID=1084522 RepID=UPI0031E593D0